MNSFQLGKLEIHRVEEFVEPNVDPAFLFGNLPIEVFERHADWLTTQNYNPQTKMVLLHFHSWLIRTGKHNILVDTCNGNHKERPYMPNIHQANYPYLERLKQAGCAPEDIDYVMCTHLHVDHVGWNTVLKDGRWVPTFPNAKYLISKLEVDPFAGPIDRNVPPPQLPPWFDIYEDSVLPVIQSGQAVLVEDAFDLNDEIRLEPAPGHTPGHSLVRAVSESHGSIFCGDAIHNPVQIAESHYNSAFCVDQDQARATRRRILEECADRNLLLVPAHFGPPYVGRIRRYADTFRFLPGL